MPTTIIVCDTCKYSKDEAALGNKTGGQILYDHVERLACGNDTLAVKRQSCLMGCDRHCNVALVAPQKLTYVLGEFEPGADAAEAIVEYASLHAQSDTGQVPFRQWPQGVKGHFVARIPALDAEAG